MSPIRLKPSNIKAIARLLEESYDCVQPQESGFKTTPGKFKDTPTLYLDLLLHKGQLAEVMRK